MLFALLFLEGLPWLLGALRAPAALQAGLAAALSPHGWLLYALCFLLVFVACFLDVEDTPREVAEYILKVGARIPGVRPGEGTVRYLRETQAGARFWGGVLLGLLSTASLAVDKWMQAAYGQSIGFTSLLIIVSAPPSMVHCVVRRAALSPPTSRLAPCSRCAARCEPSRRSRDWPRCSPSFDSGTLIKATTVMSRVHHTLGYGSPVDVLAPAPGADATRQPIKPPASS